MAFQGICCLTLRSCSWFAVTRLIKQHTQISSSALTSEIKLHLITPSCSLWSANIDEVPFKDPFWAFYWPGGQAIARYILDHPKEIQGRSVLDLGSGSGACAVAAAMTGTTRRVTANDIDTVAVAAIKLNAAVNQVELDVSTDDLIGRPCEAWDCILVGDMFYDADFAGQLLSWLRSQSRQGKLVLVGDPGRQAHRDIAEGCMTRVARYALPEESCLENRGFTHASVWRFI